MASEKSSIPVTMPYTYHDILVFAVPLLGVIWNALFLFAVFKDPLKCFRNSRTYFVTNLSVSDGLTCLFAPSFYIEVYIVAKYSIFKILVVWFGVASLVSLASISVDRFLMIAYPFKHRILMKGRVIVRWLAAIWLVTFAIAVLTLHAGWENQRIHVYIFCASIMTLTAFIYVFTYQKLKQQSRSIARQSTMDTGAQMKHILKEKQFLKTIILIACIAFACTVPSMITFQILDLLGLKKDKLIFRKISLSIFYINVAVNPLIYVLRLPKYRKTFFLVYWKRC